MSEIIYTHRGVTFSVKRLVQVEWSTGRRDPMVPSFIAQAAHSDVNFLFMNAHGDTVEVVLNKTGAIIDHYLDTQIQPDTTEPTEQRNETSSKDIKSSETGRQKRRRSTPAKRPVRQGNAKPAQKAQIKL